MGVPLGVQGLRLLLAAVQGLGTGLLYDLLRPLRRRAGRVAAAAADVLFALLAGIGAFLFAMGAGSGRLGQWELAAMLLGFLLYLRLLSPAVLPLVDGGEALAFRIVERYKKSRIKFLFLLKKHFQNLKKCNIVRR